MRRQSIWTKLGLIALGSVLFALGFDVFLQPNGINCGGMSGIAMLIVYVVKIPWLTVGMVNIAINVPLFFFGFRSIGKGFFFGSLLGMFSSSVAVDLLAKILPPLQTEPIVAMLFGGGLVGAGVGVVFLADASTGGVDIMARLAKLKLRNFPIGKLILAVDLFTALLTGIVYKQINNALFSVISLIFSSIILDRVVYGMDYSQVALIVSDRPNEIARQIALQLERGVTFLRGQGYYSGNEKTVLLSAVKRKQLAQLKELVMTEDPNAFLILQDAKQVLGDGFKRYDRLEL